MMHSCCLLYTSEQRPQHGSCQIDVLRGVVDDPQQGDERPDVCLLYTSFVHACLGQGLGKAFQHVGTQCAVRHPVSYTHLDVYKRQGVGKGRFQQLRILELIADDGFQLMTHRFYYSLMSFRFSANTWRSHQTKSFCQGLPDPGSWPPSGRLRGFQLIECCLHRCV